MTRWFVPARTTVDVPGVDDLAHDWIGPLVAEAEGDVLLEKASPIPSPYYHLDVELTVEADDAEEATRRAGEWLEGACKGATEWRKHGLRFPDEVRDGDDASVWQIGDIFDIGEPSELDPEDD